MSNILSGVDNNFDPRPSTSASTVPVSAIASNASERSASGSRKQRGAASTTSRSLQMCSQQVQNQLPWLFSNTQITGGVFNFTFNIAAAGNNSSPRLSSRDVRAIPSSKRRSRTVLYSDSDLRRNFAHNFEVSVVLIFTTVDIVIISANLFIFIKMFQISALKTCLFECLFCVGEMLRR